MNLDLRLPIGIMFSLYGALLAIFGMTTNKDDIYHRSLDININLFWGLTMLGFGGLMLIMALRARARTQVRRR